MSEQVDNNNLSDEDFLNSFDDNNVDAEQERERVHSESSSDEGFNNFEAQDDDEEYVDLWDSDDSFVDPRLDNSYDNTDSESSNNNDDEDEDDDDFNELDLESDYSAVLDEEEESVSTSNVIPDDKLIQALKEKGYKIEEPEDEDAARVNSIGQLDQVIDNINGVLNYPEDKFLELALRNQLAVEYNNQGKGHQVQSDVFEEELRDKIDDLKLNPTFKSMFIDTQKQGLRNALKDKEDQRLSLKQEHQRVLDERAQSLKMETRQNIVDLSKIYGLKKNEAKEVYEFMKSDEYKTLSQNPKFVVRAVIAELAERKGKQLFNNDDRYSRGVKDTLDEIRSNGEGRQSNSLLGRQTRGQAIMSTPKYDPNVWAAAIRPSSEELKKEEAPKRAAGGFRR